MRQNASQSCIAGSRKRIPSDRAQRYGVRGHRNCLKKIKVAAAEIVIRGIKYVGPNSGHLIEFRYEWMRGVDRKLNIGRPAEVRAVNPPLERP